MEMTFREFYRLVEGFNEVIKLDEISFEIKKKDGCLGVKDSDFDLMDEEEQFDEVKKERTRLDRMKTRAMKAALNVATKGQWDSWDLRKRAAFRAKFEYKAMTPTKGRFIRRDKPLNVAVVMKQLKKKSKRLKKLMKTRGKQIQRKAQMKRGR